MGLGIDSAGTPGRLVGEYVCPSSFPFGVEVMQ
jgi:hypothetical protein